MVEIGAYDPESLAIARQESMLPDTENLPNISKYLMSLVDWSNIIGIAPIYNSDGRVVAVADIHQRAILKLISPLDGGRTLAIMSLCIAVVLDSMIIVLCFVRGRKSYTNHLKQAVALARVLFVDQDMQKSSDATLRHIAASIGALYGICTYVGYALIFSSANNIEWFSRLVFSPLGTPTKDILANLHVGLVFAIIGSIVAVLIEKAIHTVAEKYDSHIKPLKSVLVSYSMAIFVVLIGIALSMALSVFRYTNIHKMLFFIVIFIVSVVAGWVTYKLIRYNERTEDPRGGNVAIKRALVRKRVDKLSKTDRKAKRTPAQRLEAILSNSLYQLLDAQIMANDALALATNKVNTFYHSDSKASNAEEITKQIVSHAEYLANQAVSKTQIAYRAVEIEFGSSGNPFKDQLEPIHDSEDDASQKSQNEGQKDQQEKNTDEATRDGASTSAGNDKEQGEEDYLKSSHGIKLIQDICEAYNFTVKAYKKVIEYIGKVGTPEKAGNGEVDLELVNAKDARTKFDQLMFPKVQSLLKEFELQHLLRITIKELSPDSFFRNIELKRDKIRNPLFRIILARHYEDTYEHIHDHLRGASLKWTWAHSEEENLVDAHCISVEKAHELFVSYKFGILKRRKYISIARIGEGKDKKEYYVFEDEMFDSLEKLTMDGETQMSAFNIGADMADADDEDERGDAFNDD